MFWLGFIVGIVVGGIIGVAAMALLVVRMCDDNDKKGK